MGEETMKENKYVLMEWGDGWREVTPVEADATGLRKYFVLERVEYYGRLVVERPGGEVPDLIVTDRKPFEVKRVALVGSHASALKKASLYEEGGRVEHNYDLVSSSEDLVAALTAEFKEALKDEGLTSADLMERSPAERREIIGRAAAGMKLVAGKTQDDLIEFVEGLLHRG